MTRIPNEIIQLMLDHMLLDGTPEAERDAWTECLGKALDAAEAEGWVMMRRVP